MIMQRARGELGLVVRRRGAVTALADLRQEGCLKIRFPHADAFEAVFLNSSGGVAGGDRLRIEVTVGAEAEAVVATQAAERFYRARSADLAASVHSTVRLDSGARLDWLPQEGILFDRCAVDRRLDVTMAEDATFLGVESLVFGRAAMGETLTRATIAETITIRRGGRLILHDAIRLSGDVAGHLARPAIADGAAAVALLVLVAPGAESSLETLRAALEASPVEAGASAWDGMLVARVLARDAQTLRIGLMAALSALRGARKLPRVWMC